MSASASPNPKPPFWTIARRDAAAGYVFIAPQLIGIITFVLVPLGLVFWYSLHEWNVLAASFKTPRQALDCLLAGCESITLPLDVAQQFITSPAVDAAIVKFEQDWQGAFGRTTL